jgi:hypothetical protein
VTGKRKAGSDSAEGKSKSDSKSDSESDSESDSSSSGSESETEAKVRAAPGLVYCAFKFPNNVCVCSWRSPCRRQRARKRSQPRLRTLARRRPLLRKRRAVRRRTAKSRRRRSPRSRYACAVAVVTNVLYALYHCRCHVLGLADSYAVIVLLLKVCCDLPRCLSA